MRLEDFEQFEQHFERLCAGFDTPPTQARKDAYWQAFKALPLQRFTKLVNDALASGRFEKMPSTGQLWGINRQTETPPPSTPNAPTLQEQLCEYVMCTHFRRGKDERYQPDQQRQIEQPWTYQYREWREGDRRCAECVGVMVPACGPLSGFRVTVAEMLADPIHEYVMRKLAGQASSRAQSEAA